jgi:gamma-glutamyltranspeptidase/glutathione hydrolase
MSKNVMSNQALTLVLALCLAVSCAPPPSGTATAGSGTRVNFPFDWRFRGHEPTGEGTQGMVASADIRATRVGVEVLQLGGTAVDAAIAMGFALAVVHPAAGNIGGGGFAVIRMADGSTAALDFREMAPILATQDLYLDDQGKPTNASRVGYLSVGVPGTVAGLWELHQRYGTVAWDELVEPAIDLADNGFTVTESINRGLTDKAELFANFETTQQIFYPGGQPLRAGTTFQQSILANTLRQIANGGKQPFYSGSIADAIVEDMREHNGLITHEDLRQYRAVWRDPLTFQYRGHTVISMPPPSSGGVAIAEALNILEGYNLEELGFNSPETVHLLAESFRRSFGDRNFYMGDPDYVDIPVERLISDEYATELRATISRNRASSSEEFNRVPVLNEGSNTTHFSIVDAQGNAVAFTYTINSSYGSGVVVARGGFFLNNEMDDFTVRAGFANLYGLVQSNANLVAPGHRPLSSMTPTIVLDPMDQLLLVTGSPGGAKIITAVTQSIINVVDFRMAARWAVDAPRIHHQLLPDEILYEMNGLDAATRSTLTGMGHRVMPSPTYFGDVEIIVRGSDGTLHGASDPRRPDGRALGY